MVHGDEWRITPAGVDTAGGFSVHRVEVTDPCGRRHHRSYLHTPEVVVLVAEHGGQVLFVREFRAAAGGVVLTLPMGKVDGGATPAQAASAELAEETGHVAARLERVGVLLTAPGWMDQRTTVFHATGLTPADRPTPTDPEERYLRLVRIPLGDLAGLIAAGELRDSRSVAALALVFGLRQRE
jgi:8-oxo-dGTP pyrophosphatase MutT (NUDIX family)